MTSKPKEPTLIVASYNDNAPSKPMTFGLGWTNGARLAAESPG
jgi:hypothetical protein